jgi:hypothetical protein
MSTVTVPATLGDLWDLSPAERALAELVAAMEHAYERDRRADEVTDEQLSNASETVEALLDLASRAKRMRVGEIREALSDIAAQNRFEPEGVRYRTY